MTYTPGIPNAGDLLSVSQGQIKTNFTQLNTQFGGLTPSTGGDHDGFNNGSGNGSGMHNQVTFTANQAAPSLTRNSISGVSGLYANLSGGLSELFFQNATQNFQLTGLPVVTTTPSATGFGITTPWGIKVNWRQKTNVGTGGTAITFQVPFSNNSYGLTLTPVNTGATSVSVGNSYSSSGFTAYSTNTNTVFFIAIGV